VDRASDLDHLLLRGAERRHQRARVDREIEPLQVLLSRDIDAPQPIEEAFRP
jgi:hypothetical protein